MITTRDRVLSVLYRSTEHLLSDSTLCGLRGCMNWPAPFPGRMSYKAT